MHMITNPDLIITRCNMIDDTFLFVIAVLAARTFLKNRASDPVRRGRPFPVWLSEVVGAVGAGRLGEAVSRN